MAKKLGIISDTHGLLRPEVMEISSVQDTVAGSQYFHHLRPQKTVRSWMNSDLWRPFMPFAATMTGSGRRVWRKLFALP